MPEEPQIDIALPEDRRKDADGSARETVPNHDNRDRQRAAIAAARAIRRAAAAKERDEKQRASDKAKAIVSPFRSAFRKADRRTAVRGSSTTGTTGILRWIESMRKPDDAEPVQTPQDNDELVAQLAAEKEALRSQALHPASVDDIVAQITAEQHKHENGGSPVITPALDEGADPREIVEAIAAQLAPGIKPHEVPAESAVTDESARPEPVRETGGQLVDRIIEQIEAEKEPEPEQPRQSYVEALTAAHEARSRQAAEQTAECTEPDPAQNAPVSPVPDEKIIRQRAEQQAAAHAREMAAAEEQFALDTAAAKPFVRRLKRKTERTWQHEAAAEQAVHALPKTKRVAAFVNIGVCMAMFFGIAAGMLILERPTVSEIENRNLATMPEFSLENYISGKFTNGVAEYYNDTVPYRSLFKDLTAQMRQWMGLKDEDDAVIQDAGGSKQNEEPEEPAVTTAVTEDPLAGMTAQHTTTAAETQQEEPDDPNKDQGEMSKRILVVNKRGIMLFGGSFAMGERYAKIVNNYKSKLGDSVSLWSMVIPTPCSFYTPEKYKNLNGSEKDNIDHINEYLEGVTPVDAYGPLEAHADENIFMRTDHHWASLGAFYAAEEFSKTARVPFARISEYDKIEKEGYVGTLYGFSNNIILKNNPETFTYYVPHAQFDVTYWNRDLTHERHASLFMSLNNVKPVGWYMVYLGGDDRVTRIQTGVKNGRKLAVIKDSYGNALIPWLTSSFEEITVIDMRYFTHNVIDYLKEIGTTDLLFAMNTFSALGSNAAEMEKITKQ